MGRRILDTPKSVEKLLLVRKGHSVKRCHTEPIIGNYFVGQHSAGVAALLLAFTNGEASSELLTAALYHDVPECVLGDLPAPTRWYNTPETQHALDLAENRFIKAHGLYVQLDSEEKELLYVADKMELMFFCKEQRGMGNTLVDGMFWRLVDRLSELAMIEGSPEPCQELFSYLVQDYPERQESWDVWDLHLGRHDTENK